MTRRRAVLLKRKGIKPFGLTGLIFLMTMASWSKGHCLTTEETNTIELYKKVAAGVVNISSKVIRHDFFLRPIPAEGTGSGVIIDEDGIIITNHHVIKDASRVEVTLADGSKWPARVVGKTCC